MMALVVNELPFGSEFSPSQIDLPRLLEIVHDTQGNRDQMRENILTEFFASHAQKTKDAAKQIKNQKTLALNCTIALTTYGIIDKDGNFTPVGQTLYNLRGTPTVLYDELARHILLHLNGMRLIAGIQSMMAAGEEVTLDTLREGLKERGLNYPRGGKHPSMMRLWLAKAGVFAERNWQVNTIRLRQVLGTDDQEFAVLSRFTSEQRAFLMALANTGVTTEQPANEIVKLATATYGVRFPEKSLPKQVLNAIEEAGYITTTRTTDGRGSRSPDVKPTAKLRADIIAPLLEQLKGQIDPKLLDLLDKPLADILVEVQSEDKYEAGLGLEALAFKLMRTLAMTYVATRLRAQDTGGAEIDLIFESARLVFSRWQVQCKRTARVALDDIAKEVGLTHFLKSNVIVVVTTGDVGSQARRYANKIMRDSNLCIVLITGSDLEGIKTNPAFIVDAFRREAEYAMTLKKIDLGETVET
jgi:site-specific DNA-methyltransferase (cytosine-N4-specific)